jgi:hypothetical protein
MGLCRHWLPERKATRRVRSSAVCMIAPGNGLECVRVIPNIHLLFYACSKGGGPLTTYMSATVNPLVFQPSLPL